MYWLYWFTRSTIYTTRTTHVITTTIAIAIAIASPTQVLNRVPISSSEFDFLYLCRREFLTTVTAAATAITAITAATATAATATAATATIANIPKFSSWFF